MNLQQLQAFAAAAVALGPLVHTLFTTIDDVVKSVEVALPNTPGTQKFQAAMTKIEAIYGEVATAAPGVFGALVNASVAAFNLAGVFKKSTPAASPAPTASQASPST